MAAKKKDDNSIKTVTIREGFIEEERGVGTIENLIFGNQNAKAALPQSTIRGGAQCNCCPYGYHIDLDFVTYCEELYNGTYHHNAKHHLCKEHHKHRKSPEISMGIRSHLANRFRNKTGDSSLLKLDNSLNYNEKWKAYQTCHSHDSHKSPLTPLKIGISIDTTDAHLSNIRLSPQSQNDGPSLTPPFTTSHSRSGSNTSLSSTSTEFNNHFHHSNNSSKCTCGSQQIADTMAALNSASVIQSGLPPGYVGINTNVLSTIRSQVATSLQRMKELEEQAKAVPVLQVKLSVLNEEKRLLLLQLKNKSQNLEQKSINKGENDIKGNDDSLSYAATLPRFRKRTLSGTSLGRSEVPMYSSTGHLTYSLDEPLEKHNVIDLKDFHSHKRIYDSIEKFVNSDNDSICSVKELRNVGTSCAVLTRDIGVGHVAERQRSVGIGDEKISTNPNKMCVKCGTSTIRSDILLDSLSSSEFAGSESDGESNKFLQKRILSKQIKTLKTEDKAVLTDPIVETSKSLKLTSNKGEQISILPFPLPCTKCEEKAAIKYKSIGTNPKLIDTCFKSSGVNTDRVILKHSNVSTDNPKLLTVGSITDKILSESVDIETELSSNDIDALLLLQQKRKQMKDKGTGVPRPLLANVRIQTISNTKDSATSINIETQPIGIQVNIPVKSPEEIKQESSQTLPSRFQKHSFEEKKIINKSVQTDNIQTIDASCGSCSIHDTFCNRCELRQMETIGVGDQNLYDVLCDRCQNVKLTDVAVGEEKFPVFHSIGINTVETLDRTVSSSDSGIHVCDKCNAKIKLVAKDLVDKNMDNVLHSAFSHTYKEDNITKTKTFVKINTETVQKITSNQKIEIKENNNNVTEKEADKDSVDKNALPGVYRIPVTDTRRQNMMFYIGATGRSLKERMAEHQRNIRSEQPCTALAAYVLADPQEVKAEWDQARLIQIVRNKKHLQYAEAWHICKASQKGLAINFRDSSKVKLSVLNEEKRLLLLQLKNKSQNLEQKSINKGENDIKGNDDSLSYAATLPRFRKRTLSGTSLGRSEVPMYSSTGHLTYSLDEPLEKHNVIDLKDFHSHKRIYDSIEKFVNSDNDSICSVKELRNVGTSCAVLTRDIGVGHVAERQRSVGIGDEKISTNPNKMCVKCGTSTIRSDILLDSLSSSEFAGSESDGESNKFLQKRILSKQIKTLKTEDKAVLTDPIVETSKSLKLTSNKGEQISILPFPLPCTKCEEKAAIKYKSIGTNPKLIDTCFKSSGVNTDRVILKHSNVSTDNPKLLTVGSITDKILSESVDIETELSSNDIDALLLLQQKRKQMKDKGTGVPRPLLANVRIQTISNTKDSATSINIETQPIGIQVNIPVKSPEEIKQESSQTLPSRFQKHSFEEKKIINKSVQTDNIQTIDASCGSCSIHDTFCNRCELRQMETIGVGDQNLYDVLCDRCQNVKLTDVAVGEEKFPVFHSIGINTVETLDRTVSSSDSGIHVCDKCNAKIKLVAKDLVDKNMDNVLHSAFSHTYKEDNITKTKTFVKINTETVQKITSNQKIEIKENNNNVTEKELTSEHSPCEADLSDSSSESPDEKSYNGILSRIISRHKTEHLTQQEKNEAVMFESYEIMPRKKTELSKEMKESCKVLNESLVSPQKGTELASNMEVIQKEWFQISSCKDSDPHVVEDYLDAFEEISKHLLHRIVNLTDANGNTAMHYAVSHGNFDVVSVLLDSKVCDANIQNKAGYTAVMLISLAEIRNEAHKQVVRRLFQINDINLKASQNGQTALMLAASQGRVEAVKLLLECGAEINMQDKDGSTALMCAAEHGHGDVVHLLLSIPDCDPSLTDNDGSSALSIAMDAGHRDVALMIYANMNFSRGSSPYSSLRTRRSRTVSSSRSSLPTKGSPSTPPPSPRPRRNSSNSSTF
ncbi:KN motif and ankyrin repeat domain-containing protein 1-like [Centruroides sculpturatus]|uniref:KN motif and ankyrin repeat domain-containing protein 1-like n=1 Tax=Centruroides sculpturatus TaxID=218467 RepID=UPI000C6D449C|nr:KN motif and ankyrin repeat domain-containing protein 1-like [Centruroides sculpturatus]